MVTRDNSSVNRFNNKEFVSLIALVAMNSLSLCTSTRTFDLILTWKSILLPTSAPLQSLKIQISNMSSRSTLPRPWLHSENNSSVALSGRGREFGIPPGQEPPSPNQYRELVTPTNDERYRTWNRVANTIAEQRASSPAATSAWSTGSSSQVSPHSSFHYEQGLQPMPQSSTPRLQSTNTSSRKIKQLTGFEIGPDKVFPGKYLQANDKVASTKDSDSEGSVYSQPDTSAQSSQVQLPDAKLRAHTLSRLQQNVAPSAEDIFMLQKILTEQQKRYEEALLHDMGGLMPKPLAIRSKRAKRKSLRLSGPSIWKNARDSFEWGINELTSPKAKKAEKATRTARFAMESGDTTPEEMPPTPPPKGPRRKKKSFVLGDHPLKSPYPFLSKDEDADVVTSPAEGRFGSKISDAVKSLASGRRSSQTKKIVTSNKTRKNSTPDTPASSKSTFIETIRLQKGNGQLQEIIEKTKKTVLRTADEKRRDELKKIVVVGTGDQSPSSYP